MRNRIDPVSTSGRPRSDPEFMALLASYIEQLNLKGEIDPDQILESHPRFGPALLEDLNAFIELEKDENGEDRLGSLGDFTLRGQIGRGGMGVVYDAWQNSVERQVALKVLPAGLAADDRLFHRFLREARAAGKLHHPNVVAVYSMGQDENTPYFAMEFVEGMTLEQIISKLRSVERKANQRQTLLRKISKILSKRTREAFSDSSAEHSPDFVIKRTVFRSDDADLRFFGHVALAFAGVADGLQHAHTRGVIHRDVKPSNLILDRDGRLRILDFGLAHQEGLERLTATDALVGTPLYMSPEQCRVRKTPVDHRTDVYSLGATLYEVLTRHSPFEGKNYQDTLNRIVSKEPEPPRKLCPKIPRDLETIVLKCLRKSPLGRFGTAEALGQDLRRFVRGDPIEARPQPPIERFIRRIKRHSLKIGVASIAILLAVFSGVLVYQYRANIAEAQAAEERRARDVYNEELIRAVSRVQLGEMDLHVSADRPSRLDPVEIFSILRVESVTDESSRAELDDVIRDLRDLISELPSEIDGHEAYYHLARALDLRGDREGTVETLTALLAVRPGFVPALVLLANTQRQLGERRRAAATDKAARDAAEASTVSWEKSWYGARTAERERRWADAVLAYSLLMDSIASGAEPYEGFRMETRVRRGQARLAAKELTGALADFTIANFEWPDAMEPKLLLGRVLRMKGEKEEAREVLQALYDERPPRQRDLAAAWIMLVYNYAHDWEAALEWSGKIRQEVLQHRLGSFYLANLDRFEEAEQAASRAIALNENDPASHHILGVALLGQKRYAEAVASCEKAIVLDPDDFGPYFTRGRILYEQGRLAESVPWYRKAFERNKEYHVTLANLGAALFRTGEVEEGIDLLEKGHDLRPTALGCTFLALALGEDKSPEVQKRKNDLFVEAITIDPDCWLAWFNLGVTRYKDRGEFLDGLEKLLAAAKLNPDWHMIHAHLGKVYEHLGLEEDSVEHYLRAAKLAQKSNMAAPIYLRDIMKIGNTMVKSSDYPQVQREGLDLLRSASEDERFAKDYRVLSDYAGALITNERYDEALKVAGATLKLNASHPFAIANRGIALGKTGRPAEALRVFLGALEINRRQYFAYTAEHVIILLGDHRDASFGSGIERLESALQRELIRDGPNTKAAWNMWLTLRLWCERKEVDEVLAECDALAADAPAESKTGARAYVRDIRWALERLRDDKALRINSGGKAHRGTGGERWSRDRLYVSGAEYDLTEDVPNFDPLPPEITGTDDPTIYRTARRFRGEIPGPAGYRFPVLPGDYRVTLHFVELDANPSAGRIFGIKLGDETVIKKYKAQRAGVGTADRKSFEMRGVDALLGILFLPVRGSPRVCAIEIERM